MIEGLLIGAVIAYGYQSYHVYRNERNAGWPRSTGLKIALTSKSANYVVIALTGLIGSAIS